ncbi:MAG: PocR ligand-binding domain-containing protein [Kiritimatiellae bacterium]|nr:PocR ligand-binding domain-containing protein [Kiritimatiellia bacterium]MDD5522369.1 PocR ligand-binding domain-containing protein [Kiritimatiellia bacterium]
MIEFDDLAESKEFRQFFIIVRELTGIPVGLVSPDGKRSKLLFTMDTWTPLCRLIRTHPLGRKGCHDTDSSRLRQAFSSKQVIHYLCHAGLIDMMMPVVINGEHVATINCGQVLPEPHSEKRFRQLQRRLNPMGFSSSALRKAYYASPYCSLEKIKIIMNLFSFFIEYFGEISWRLKQVRQKDFIPVQQAQKFIHNHFQEHMTLRDVARSASLSPHYFSSLFHEMTGMTVKKYLQTIRINAAKQLLNLTSERITDIAFDVGFNNLTDFNRVFRRTEYCSPKQYRRLRRSGKC